MEKSLFNSKKYIREIIIEKKSNFNSEQNLSANINLSANVIEEQREANLKQSEQNAERTVRAERIETETSDGTFI